jgi:hypothetical protein
MKKPLALATVVLGSTVAFACASSSDATPSEGSAPSAGTATLHVGTVVVPSLLANVAVVAADRVEFPASAIDALGVPRAGTILVSDRQLPGTSGRNPEGFLRKVVSTRVEGDRLILDTEDAALQEAVDDLDIQATVQLPPLALDGPATESAPLDTLKTGGTTLKLIDFSGKKLLDYSGSVTLPNQKTVGFDAFANVEKGTLQFSPSYDVGMKLGFLKVKEAHVIGKGQLDGELLVDAGVKLTSTLDSQSFSQLVAKGLAKSQTTRIAEYSVDLGSLVAGPIKIPIGVDFTTDVVCDFAWGGGVEVKAGAKISSSMTVGVAYDAGFKAIYDKKSSFVPEGPTFVADGAVRAKCAIVPRLKFKFFGLASAEITARAYAGVGGSITCGGTDSKGNKLALVHGDLQAGVNATVLAKVDVLKLHYQKACTLFDANQSVQWDRAFPLPGGSQATCTSVNSYGLLPEAAPLPEKCFAKEDANSQPPAPIPGTCTHDVCTAGEKLGQACDACTQKVCAQDPYCCDTYWGLSCFADVTKLCGKTCN